MRTTSLKYAVAANLLMALIAATAMGPAVTTTPAVAEPIFRVDFLPDPYGDGCEALGVAIDRFDSSTVRVYGSAFIVDDRQHIVERPIRWMGNPHIGFYWGELPRILNAQAAKVKGEMERYDDYEPPDPRPPTLLGSCTEASGAIRAVVWEEEDDVVTLTVLPNLPGGLESDALGGMEALDSDTRYVAGWAEDGLGIPHGTVWINNGIMTQNEWFCVPLPDLGDTLESSCQGMCPVEIDGSLVPGCYGSVFDEDGREIPALWYEVGTHWVLEVADLPEQADEGRPTAVLYAPEAFNWGCEPGLYHPEDNDGCPDTAYAVCPAVYCYIFMTNEYRLQYYIEDECECIPDIPGDWVAVNDAWHYPWQNDYYLPAMVGSSPNEQMRRVATMWELDGDIVNKYDLNDLALGGPPAWPLRSAEAMDGVGRIVGIARIPGPGPGIPQAFIATPMHPAGVENAEHPGVPGRFQLRTSTNPFGEKVAISYRIEEGARVSVDVYDILGREVARLADGWHTAGHHQQVWEGLGRRGEQMPSGIYWIRVQSGTIRESRAVVMSR
jgi:hypothetical protein